MHWHLTFILIDIDMSRLEEIKGSSWYKWVVVALLSFVALLNYLDRQVLSTMKEAMSLDITELQDPRYFGWLMAIFLWIYGLVSPFAGAIADRVSRKWLIVGSLGVWSAVTLAMGFVEDFHVMLGLRAFMGVSEALYIPAGLALITEYHQGKTRSLAVGLHMTGLYLGQALGGYGAKIAGTTSWHNLFIVLGGIGVTYAVVLAFLLMDKRVIPARSNTKTSVPVVKSLGHLFRTPAFWVLLFVFAVPSLPGWATKNWLPTLFSENLGMSMEEAGPLATISIAASSFVGVLCGGILSDRWSSKNLRGRVYTSAIGLALTIPSLVLIGLGHTVVALFGAAFMFGVGFGLFDANNMPILCQFVPDNLRSTAYGFMNMMGVFSGAIITSVLGNFTAGGNLGMAFSALGGIVLVALLLQLLFLRPKHIDMKAEEFFK